MALFRARWRDLRAARQQDAAYRRIWQAFRRFATVEDGRHDTDAWRAHGGAFAACIVRVPADALRPSLDELRAALEPCAFVRLHPDPFLHVMLQELGFVVQRPTQRDEISQDRLDEFVVSATAAMATAQAFDLRLGGANSFQDAAFLDVHDRGACARLHTRLNELAAAPIVSRFAYLPHLTVAHYTESAPIGNLPATISAWRDRRFGEVVVDRIEIVLMAPDEPYPPLAPYAEIRLGA